MGQRFKLMSPNYKTLKAQEKIFTLLGLVMISEHDIKSICHKEKNRHNVKINLTCIGTYIYTHKSIYRHTRIHIHVYVCAILLSAWGILVPQPEIEPGSSAVKSRSPKHCIIREFPILHRFYHTHTNSLISTRI